MCRYSNAPYLLQVKDESVKNGAKSELKEGKREEEAEGRHELDELVRRDSI
jgi:hypothetical protein